MRVERVGVYGGTFDPIHLGHLAIAEEARWFLNLDRVLFVPAAVQPFKPYQQGAAPEQRLQMVRLACHANPAFQVSTVEIERPPPSLTADTLDLLRAAEPAWRFWFVLGADAVQDLPRWSRAQAIIDTTPLAIVGRPGYAVDTAALERALPGFRANSTFIAGPHLDISSSDLRRRIVLGRPVRYQLPEPVWNYIEHQRIYRSITDETAQQ
jgi:nicotinate (nicotinamide) nucleotide adenylyltransferase